MLNQSTNYRQQADRTNQKLYFCRIACQNAQIAPNKQLYQAECEAAIFHLRGAFLAFLQELAQFYGISDPKPSLSTLEANLAQKTQISPEIQRLTPLVQAGFLADIMQAYENSQYSPQPNKSPVQTVQTINPSQNRIDGLINLNPANLPDDGTIAQWRIQFSNLIDELRAGMATY